MRYFKMSPILNCFPARQFLDHSSGRVRDRDGVAPVADQHHHDWSRLKVKKSQKTD